MLSDGNSTYLYDHANRLISIASGSNTTTFTYNGGGDQLTETTNGAQTIFTLDLNQGLTQVLSDGTNTYLYGINRISQTSSAAGTSYFLSDALGSGRQLSDGQGKETLAQWYEPYGDMLVSVGSAKSVYGYAGEMQDRSIKLIDLRARWYDPTTAMFTSHDTWPGDSNRPLSFNGWSYVMENPIHNVDPTGMITKDEATQNGGADDIVDYLQNNYSVTILRDWGYFDINSGKYSDTPCGDNYWHNGSWTSLNELKWAEEGIEVHV